MIRRIADSDVVARHSLSFVVVVVLAITLYCVIPYLRLTIEYGPNPGPFADMSGIGFIIWGAICAPLFLVILALIACISEFGRRFLLPRMNLLLSTILVSLFFLVAAFIFPLLVLSLIFGLEWSQPMALAAAGTLGPLGIVYWLVLNLSRHLFPGHA